MPLDITIVLPVKNEERNLPGCLESIGKDFAQQVVIVDSSSTDRTCAIAREWGADVIKFEWNGKFPKKRNWYLRNYKPSTRWVLFLDADEYLTPQFKEAVAETLKDGSFVGYWLNYSIYFLGKPLRGGYPLKKLALFRPNAGEYERIDEEAWSHLDMEVHEHPVLNGKVGEISPKIDHRDLRGVEAWAIKHAAYASWEARRYLQLTSDDSIRRQWTFLQKIKYRLMDTPWIAPVFFFGSFIFLRGFLDGRRGFAWAMLKAGYFTQVYARIQEEKQNRA